MTTMPRNEQTGPYKLGKHRARLYRQNPPSQETLTKSITIHKPCEAETQKSRKGKHQLTLGYFRKLVHTYEMGSAGR